MSNNFWNKDEEQKKVSDITKVPNKAIDLSEKNSKNGIAQLFLTIIELIRQLMEKQAMRRVENNSLDEEQIEKLGVTFMNLKQEIDKLKTYFNLDDKDLDLDLGAIGHLIDNESNTEPSLVNVLDKIISKGVLVLGDITLSVADVELISLSLRLVLASTDKKLN